MHLNCVAREMISWFISLYYNHFTVSFVESAAPQKQLVPLWFTFLPPAGSAKQPKAFLKDPSQDLFKTLLISLR